MTPHLTNEQSQRKTREMKLKVLRNPECKACELHKTSTNVCVMGRGDVMAPIHLIGEAPGSMEAETGKPFMGVAGTRVLNPTLEELGMEWMVYISNVCRCRPPGNRTPTNEEMNTCSHLYLQYEVNIVKPRIIVAMGATASSYFFGNSKLVKGVVQRPTKSPIDVPVIPTWHPAYCLPHRGGELYRARLREHLKLAMAYVNG